MNLIDTSSQPFIVCVLVTAGLFYSLFVHFISIIAIKNVIVYNLLIFALTIIGALIYFTILYLIYDGQMRFFTLLSFVAGLFLGFYIISKHFNN